MSAAAINATYTVDVVGPFDVLLGQGNTTYTSDGNQWFLRATKVLQLDYYSGAFRTKHYVARAVIAAISSRGGRFLKKVHSENRDRYSVVPLKDKVVLEKVQARLRELCRTLKQQGIPCPPKVHFDDATIPFLVEKLQNEVDKQEKEDEKPAKKPSSPVVPKRLFTKNNPVPDDNQQQHNITFPTVNPSTEIQLTHEGAALEGEDFRCNSTRSSAANSSWRMYSLQPQRASPSVWAFFNFVLLVQIVIILDSTIIKIFCWIFKKAPYIKSCAIVNSNGGGQMGGLVWQLACNLRDSGYVVRAIQIYGSTPSTETQHPFAATTVHQDGHSTYEKALFRVGGGFAITQRCGSILHLYDCSQGPRLFHGTRNALCGESGEGRNNGMYHQGMKQEDKPSIVLQIIPTDRGNLSEDDCKRILMIVEDTAIQFYNSGIHSCLLRVVRGFFEAVGTTGSDNQGNYEAQREVSAQQLQHAFKQQYSAHNPPSTEDLTEMESLLPQLSQQAFTVQLPKLRAYTPAGTATAFVHAELEKAFELPLISPPLQLPSNRRSFTISGSFMYHQLGFSFDPNRDCLFAGNFAGIQREVRRYSGFKTFESIALKYLKEYFSTSSMLEKAEMRFEIVVEFNQAKNGGWFFYLSKDDWRLHRLSYYELLHSVKEGKNPFLTRIFHYLAHEHGIATTNKDNAVNTKTN